VCVVYVQEGVVALSECNEVRERGQVAVHAEHPVGDDHSRAARRSPLEERFDMGTVSVAIDPEIGSAQAAPVDETGMAKPVGQDQPAASSQAREDAKIGQIS
jgi:hypothetical protein